MTATQVRRLGDQLRAGDRSPDASSALETWITAHDPALAVVGERLSVASPSLAVTSRLKTTTTLMEKLLRFPTMRLDQVEDIAGVRLVGDMSLVEQDRWSIRSSPCSLAPRGSIGASGPPMDTGLSTSAGAEGVLVEMQVRTLLQN